MQFYDNSNKQGISQKIDFLCDSTDTSYPRVQKTREVNNSLEQLVGLIISADGDWQWDDTNQTDLPRGTANLVDGQETYSFAAEYLNIQMIEVLIDSSPDNFQKLRPVDSIDLGIFSPQQFFGLESDGSPRKGVPTHYDKVGDTIILYPAPDTEFVTLTAGLRVWFQRTAKLFTVASDTSADIVEPGLPSPYHEILAYMAALPYCMKFKKDRVALYEKRRDEGIRDMIKFFGRREEDKRHVMRPARIRYI